MVHSSKGLDKGVRNQLISEAGGLCVLLGPNCTIFATTADLWIPRSKNGTTERSNLRPSCSNCNRDKGDMLPSEWVQFAAKRGEDDP